MVQRIQRTHNVPRIYTLVNDSTPYRMNELSDHAYDELKKVLIIAGAFFFITIVCVMSKLQWDGHLHLLSAFVMGRIFLVSHPILVLFHNIEGNWYRSSRQKFLQRHVGTEDVLRWSPVVWLIGVCVAGTFMNLIFYCQKKYKERKRRQRDQQEELLFSLAIPRSYPCLAPPPHLGCCRSSQISVSDRGLPSYEDVITQKLEDNSLPPNYMEAVTMMNTSTPVSSVQTQTNARCNQSVDGNT